MKMIVVIVQDKDVSKLLERITQAGFGATKLASSGGFLRSGNTTLLIGVEEEKLEALLELIRDTCKQRTEMLTQVQPIIGPIDAHVPVPIEVTVGGATVFVLDVIQYLKV